ncbi:MAG: mandelate racemase/muconate lactonizing enzyme family protein [Sphaerochaeta sp.]|uniref:mandelate racemase/muconate lactonizing enzyme family protein n=1 Tax=Sphaerochaeta sp. TaxID=1972642 RepID=UPI003D12C676
MKIVNLHVHAYSANHRTPIANGKYAYASTDIVIVSLHTDDGYEGYGWAHGTKVVVETLLSLKERVIGEDPFNVERIWEKMYLPKVYGRKGFETRAISAIDIALWDLKGKVAGRSIGQLLGGYRDTVPAYIAGGYYEKGKGYAGLKKEMEANLASGAKAIKMKIGGVGIAEDLDRIDVVRDTIGPNIKILVDANNAYNRLDALKIGRELDKRDIYWFEEPLSPDDIEGCAELCRKLDTPIAIGENEYTRWGFKQLMDAHAAQIYNADAQVLGGITEWKKVADLAMANHVMIAPHGDQEIHAQLVSAIPNGLIVEYYDNNTNALKEAMFPSSLSLDPEGNVTPSKSPGLGIPLDYDRLASFLTFEM